MHDLLHDPDGASTEEILVDSPPGFAKKKSALQAMSPRHTVWIVEPARICVRQFLEAS
ncbi:MAG TPA: hypothetical protein PKE26_05530 [Kiritimatiellia bacterium]|nr:hypothetical protein [Kiritimatiellia bacterium]